MSTQKSHVARGAHLKSGLVNFILPCSVAIFRARGTPSSHLDRTHNLSHLCRREPISRRPLEGLGEVRYPYLKRISAFIEALRS